MKKKDIINKIIKEECSKHNINVTTYIFTKNELFNFKKDNPDFLFRFINKKNYSNFPAVYCCHKNIYFIYIGVDNYNILNINDMKLAVYHELRHLFQDALIDVSDFMKKIFIIENFVMRYDYMFYIENKNKFLFEIDADVYAYKMVKNKDKSYLYNKYNFILIFNKLCDILNKKPEILNDPYLKRLFNEAGYLKSKEEIICDHSIDNKIKTKIFESKRV